MIKLTLLDRQEIALNCDLIAWIRARPDTMVRLVSGESLVVREPLDEVVRRIAAYRSQVLADAGLHALLASGTPPALPASLREPDGEYVSVLEVEP